MENLKKRKKLRPSIGLSSEVKDQNHQMELNFSVLDVVLNETSVYGYHPFLDVEMAWC